MRWSSRLYSLEGFFFSTRTSEALSWWCHQSTPQQHDWRNIGPRRFNEKHLRSSGWSKVDEGRLERRFPSRVSYCTVLNCKCSTHCWRSLASAEGRGEEQASQKLLEFQWVSGHHSGFLCGLRRHWENRCRREGYNFSRALKVKVDTVTISKCHMTGMMMHFRDTLCPDLQYKPHLHSEQLLSVRSL